MECRLPGILSGIAFPLHTVLKTSWATPLFGDCLNQINGLHAGVAVILLPGRSIRPLACTRFAPYQPNQFHFLYIEILLIAIFIPSVPKLGLKVKQYNFALEDAITTKSSREYRPDM
jgi:hypothetical protein